MNNLYKGATVIVVEVANLRSEPHREANRLQVLDKGHKATLTDGPQVSPSGLTWWQLDGAGWCVEKIENDAVLEVAPATDFERAVLFVLLQEGGFTTDENDAGNWTGGSVGVGNLQGTKYGISSLSYPNIDIANLTKDQAKQIYFTDFWQRSGADRLPWPLSLAHLDASVNCGLGRASQFLMESNHEFEHYNALRRDFYRLLHQFELYGVGWMRWVDALEKAAII